MIGAKHLCDLPSDKAATAMSAELLQKGHSAVEVHGEMRCNFFSMQNSTLQKSVIHWENLAGSESIQHQKK